MMTDMQSSIAQTATATVGHSSADKASPPVLGKTHADGMPNNNGGKAPPTDRPPCTRVSVKAAPMQPT
eukprot:3970526-Prorocentrum_lima.AAC.1